MRFLRFVGVAICVFPALCFAQYLRISPTTTLVAQTSNNTSTADSFVSQSNGNLGATNISKRNIRALLYPGASTKTYAHLMVWFGQGNHMDVGYSSTDPTQVRRQVHDMISRGINGVIIDWYGPGNAEDQATRLVMAEAENHPGFTFAIMVDKGAIEWNSCNGCSPQQALIDQLQYVQENYFPSPAYMKLNGQPMVTNFDIDLHYSIDWRAVKAALSSQPAFLFQNDSGFSHVISDGSYSWVMPQTDDYGMAYLADFYATGMQYPAEMTAGATYKGFDDSLAKWGTGRVMGQRCGLTWLATFAKINSLYGDGNPLASLQLVTWNDYEEGTEIESGIDNCVSVAALLKKNTLQWTLDGDESTIDHYRVFISKDGQHLMPLTLLAPGTHSLDLCRYSLRPATYTLYVKARGKPSLANHMSGPVLYQPQCN